MKYFLSIISFVLLSFQGFAADHMIFTNMDDDGNYKELEKKKPGSMLDQAASAQEPSVKVKIRKVKGKKFKIVITGKMKAAIRGSVNSVKLDKYKDGEWEETKSVNGRYFPLEIQILDHDTISGNDVIKKGYVNVGLPATHIDNTANQKSTYEGYFKLMYEVSFDEIKKQLGTGDTPKIMAKVVIPKRWGEESAESEAETVDVDNDDGSNDKKEDTNRFFDSVEVNQ